MVPRKRRLPSRGQVLAFGQHHLIDGRLTQGAVGITEKKLLDGRNTGARVGFVDGGGKGAGLGGVAGSLLAGSLEAQRNLRLLGGDPESGG